MNIYGIVFLSVLGCLAALFLYEKFTGKRLIKIEVGMSVLSAATALANAIAASTDSEYFHTVCVVMQAATDATVEAEKLWLSGEMSKEERKEYAYLFITNALKQANIPVTEQIEDMIDGMIAIVAALLPHGLTPKAVA